MKCLCMSDGSYAHQQGSHDVLEQEATATWVHRKGHGDSNCFPFVLLDIVRTPQHLHFAASDEQFTIGLLSLEDILRKSIITSLHHRARNSQ